MGDYVFISYSNKNQLEADSVRHLFDNEGIDTWMAPWSIPAGSIYAKEINKAIKNCACFVLLLTEEAQNSIWVSKETERAVHYNKPIIPVQLGRVVLNDEFELYISTAQVIMISKIDIHIPEIEKLLNAAGAYTGKQRFSSQHSFSAESDTSNGFSLLRCRDHSITPLNKGTYIVGRDSRKSDIYIDDYMISAVHLLVIIDNNRAYIRDLNTTNGTYINGQRIASEQTVTIHHDDIIRIGCEELIIQQEPVIQNSMESTM